MGAGEGQATLTDEAQFEKAKEMVRIRDLKNSIRDERDLVFDTNASNSRVRQDVCKGMDAVAGLVSLCG